MEVTRRKDVQNDGRSILNEMTTGFGLFSSLSKGKMYFFLLFTSNLSYFNTFKLPYKIRLLAFRSPLTRQPDEKAEKQIKMAGLQFVVFALMPDPVRKEKQFRLPDDFF